MQLCPNLLTQVYSKYICERVGEVFSPQKKPKTHFAPSIFPLHLKVKLCISKINLSHVSHFFPLIANCSEKKLTVISRTSRMSFLLQMRKLHFFPKHKTTFNLENTYIWF